MQLSRGTNISREPPTVTVTSTQSMFDASLIPAPTGMPPLPTGQFMLPLGIPQEQEKNCLMNADQFNAWSCNTPPSPEYVEIHQNSQGFSILKMWGSAPPKDADGTKPRFNYTFGAQPPRVQPMQRLYWVSDLEEPARGPALHFQTTYDKLVILDASQLGTQMKAKRSPDALPEPSSPSPHYRHQILQTGQQPWFCYWNQTFVEGFIYMQQSSSAARGGGQPLAIPSSPTSRASPASFSLASTSGHSVAATSSPTVAKRNGEAIPRFMRRGADKDYSAAASSASASSFPSPTGSLPQLPFIMKVEERRVPNSAAAVQPYCQKMLVPSNGEPMPLRDDDGNPIRVNLMESDPSVSEFATAFSPKKTAAATSTAPHQRRAAEEAAELREYFRRNELWKRNDPPKSCHCLWVSPPVP
jgi:hypothetical protein